MDRDSWRNRSRTKWHTNLANLYFPEDQEMQGKQFRFEAI